MGVRKQSEQNIRKLTKFGKGTLAITLPIELIKQLGWREKQKVVVKRVPRGFLIRDWRNTKKPKAKK